MKHIYLSHPVSAERKRVVRYAGFTILDKQFMPEGFDNPEDPSLEAGEPGQREDSKALTVAQIKDALAEKGIEIPDGVTKKADLLQLLEAGEPGQD